MATSLILINGLPGTGKTTLARKLQRDLGMPMLAKDMLKEWLFDNQNLPATEETTHLLGRAAVRMLYVFIEDVLSDGKSLIAENAYYAAFARDEVGAIIKRFDVQCIEIYCTTELEENRRRFLGRIEDGARHKVHIDSERGFVVDETILKKYEPLNIGKTIQVDTTHFGNSEYDDLLVNLKKELAR